jgi:hypothetical protein
MTRGARRRLLYLALVLLYWAMLTAMLTLTSSGANRV